MVILEFGKESDDAVQRREGRRRRRHRGRKLTALELLALLPLAFWIVLALDPSRRWPAELRLPQGVAGDETAAPGGLLALVPARDEAALLPRTLPGLLSQPLPQLRILLIDDGSSDGTAEVARRLARDHGGAPLEVIEPGPAPAGWSGKVHALARGLEAARRSPAGLPEWILFSDADIGHRSGSLPALLERARGGGDGGPYDLVSVMARLHAESFWERLLIPPFVFFFQLLYPFRRVCDCRSATAAAAGGCVLVRRAALEAAGGLEAIRAEVIDDLALARQVKRAGGRLWLGLDPGIRSLRAYRGLGEIWSMISRSAFVQLRRRYDLLMLVLAGLALLVVAPPLVAGAAVGWMLLDGPTPARTTALLAALAAWLLEARALRPAVAHHGLARAWALTLPFASILFGLMTAGSAWRHATGRGPRWKGRDYFGFR